MKEKRERGTWEFELLGAFAGLLLFVCAGIFFFHEEYAPLALLLSCGIGGVMNAVLSVLRLRKDEYVLGGFLGAMSLALFVLFFLSIAGLEGLGI
ncbi:MAG: hypothetical protein Q4F41_11895 [Eubacteriales bacterium]|nr:hypothetical protein [Eubacteriales bacterium]